MSGTSPITTHVLDTQLGQPAVGLGVVLERVDMNGQWQKLASRATDGSGRIGDLLPLGSVQSGRYRLMFETGRYFDAQGVKHFYPQVTVEFQIRDPSDHYHVPLLLSPFGYSTYRGS